MQVSFNNKFLTKFAPFACIRKASSRIDFL